MKKPKPETNNEKENSSAENCLNQEGDSPTFFSRREFLCSELLSQELQRTPLRNLKVLDTGTQTDPSREWSLTAKTIQERLDKAYRIRLSTAEKLKNSPTQLPVSNGDEALPKRIACYSKALPHNKLGEVYPKAYDLLLKALQTGKPSDFESIP